MKKLLIFVIFLIFSTVNADEKKSETERMMDKSNVNYQGKLIFIINAIFWW